MRIALILAFISFLSPSAYSQSFEPGISLNTPQGIAVDEVYQVREDSKGRLFVATDQGVYVVEGAIITHYSTEDGLVDNTVFRIYVDLEDRVWAMSFHGGLCYFEDGAWHVPPFNQDYLEKTDGTFPYYFAQSESDGRYYFDNYVVDRVFYSSSLEDSTIIVDSTYAEDKDGYAAYSLFNKSGSLLFSNRAFHALRSINYRELDLSLGITKQPGITKNGLPLEYYYFSLNDENSELDMIIQFNISKPLPDSSRIISTGLHLWHEHANGSIKHISRTSAAVNSLNVYDNEIFLNHFKGGMSRYTYDQGVVTFQENSFPNQTVSDVFKASNGTYWISLAGGGLFKVHDFNIRKIPLPFNGSETIARPFFLEDSTLIVLYKNLLTRYSLNLRSGELHMEEVTNLPKTLVTEYAYQYMVTEGRKMLTKAFTVTLDSNFQIVSYSGPIQDQSAGGLKRIRSLNDSNHLYVYRDQIYRAKIDSGIVCVSPDNTKFSIEDIIIEDEKLLFATSLEGLLIMEGGVLSPAFPNHPSANTRITDYTNLGHDWYAAATKEQGVLLFNRDTVYTISSQDYLPEQFINSIGADDEHLYVGFSNSIFIARIAQGVITSYRSYSNTDLGIDGTINQFLSNDEGVFVESGTSMTFLPFTMIDAPLTRRGYSISPTGIADEEISSKNGIPHFRLERGKSGFTIQLISSFPFGNTLQTWYWRTDTTENWRLSDDGELQISNSRNGRFNLLLKYRDENGLFTDEHVALTYQVRPLLSETIWFWLIVFSPVAILTLNIIRNTLRQRRLSRELISSNMSSLKMQINPHFIFNSFNSIQYLISEKKNDTASQYLTRLAKLIRTTIERPELHRISLSEEIEYISEFLSLETMRLDGKMKFEISVSEEINQDREFIPPMLLQPILENAVWHGVSKKTEGGIVMVSVEKTSDALIVHIEDNGDGFPQDKWRAILKGGELRGSLGLRNVITRLQLLSEMHQKEYKLDLVSAQGGTHFVLTLAL